MSSLFSKIAATFDQLGSKRGWIFVFNDSSPTSGHQTQTGDLSREEGVQDEDDGLRTGVEIQLLEEERRQLESGKDMGGGMFAKHTKPYSYILC